MTLSKPRILVRTAIHPCQDYSCCDPDGALLLPCFLIYHLHDPLSSRVDEIPRDIFGLNGVMTMMRDASRYPQYVHDGIAIRKSELVGTCNAYS